MKNMSSRVQVKILDKDYQVSCPAEEKEALLIAANELDQRMRKVRNAGAMLGTDRIAVMVALNLCHELHECQRQLREQNVNVTDQTLERIASKLDDALNN